MIGRIVGWSARHHWVVVALALVCALAGALAWRRLPTDVVPDLSDPQIVLVVDWTGHPATEVASRLTRPLTRAFSDIPGVVAVRGQSMTDLAYLDVVFGSPSNLARGRAEIAARIERSRAAFPENARFQLGPLASSTGWVLQYALIDPSRGQTMVKLRALQEDLLRPRLAALPGVAEVASVGGAFNQVLVDARGSALAQHGVAFSDVVGTVDRALEERRATDPNQLEALPITGLPSHAAPVSVRDVARVVVVADAPSGSADLGGGLDAVGGIVVAHRGANLVDVVERVQRELDVLRPRLPQGVAIKLVYNREQLAGRVSDTLLKALLEEVAVVAVAILIFLLHLRSALLPLVTLPFVTLLTFGAMWLLGVEATVMSLGGIGIALGMAIDADVVALEACHRRLEAKGSELSPAERRKQALAAAASFAPAILTALVITIVSFLPVFAFSDESGRLLRPLALTKTLVLIAAGITTVTLAPALRDRWLRGTIRPEFANPLTRTLVRVYRPLVHFALSRPTLTLATAAVAVASCLPILPRLGREFLPRIDEGDLLFMPTTLPGVMPEQALVNLRRQDLAISQFPEVESVFGKVGRADTGTDPAPYSMAETTIRLAPRAEWPARVRPRWYSSFAPEPLRRALASIWPERSIETTESLIERLDRASKLPGWTSAWTAPVRARMDMMATGVRTPLGIRIVAPTPSRLDALGDSLRAELSRLPGTRSAVYESLGGENRLEFALDPELAARYDVDPELARSLADFSLTGSQIGGLDLRGRNVRVRVKQDINARGRADQLRLLTVRSRGQAGVPVPLALLGRPSFVSRPAMIRTEGGETVAYVYVDLVQGTNLEQYVTRAKGELEKLTVAGQLGLRPGERIEWTGQYELLVAGERRLRWIVPLVFLTMLGLLYLQFRSLTEAALVLVSVPFALVGSFWTLYALDYALSAPVWVGLISVVGLAMQTGVVMVVYIDQAFHRRLREGKIETREDIILAHAEGTVLRLRPKLMTIATTGAGLLPLLWATGAGAEIMKRVAAPMIGGLLTSAFLTLEVLPVLYTLWRQRQLRQAKARGIPLTTVVGGAPAWAKH